MILLLYYYSYFTNNHLFFNLFLIVKLFSFLERILLNLIYII